jgi:hypothetical protein
VSETAESLLTGEPMRQPTEDELRDYISAPDTSRTPPSR